MSTLYLYNRCHSHLTLNPHTYFLSSLGQMSLYNMFLMMMSCWRIHPHFIYTSLKLVLLQMNCKNRYIMLSFFKNPPPSPPESLPSTTLDDTRIIVILSNPLWWELYSFIPLFCLIEMVSALIPCSATRVLKSCSSVGRSSFLRPVGGSNQKISIFPHVSHWHFVTHVQN